MNLKTIYEQVSKHLMFIDAKYESYHTWQIESSIKHNYFFIYFDNRNLNILRYVSEIVRFCDLTKCNCRVITDSNKRSNILTSLPPIFPSAMEHDDIILVQITERINSIST